MVDCGAATVQTRRQTGYPDIPLLDSVKLWQRTYFYCKSAPAEGDQVGLPEYSEALPTAKRNWGLKTLGDQGEVDKMLERMRVLSKDGLTGLDLITCWLSRRVQPLQGRVHKLCFWSGKSDPTRISTKKLAPARL